MDDDVAVMRAMLARLRELAPAWCGAAVHVKEVDAAGLRTWIRVPDLDALLRARELTTVGFFGRARDGVDHAPIHELERQIVDTLERVPGVLAYFDLELAGGRYGNLILCADEETPAQLHTHELHRRAVELTPRHYHSARIHRGRVATPLLDGGELVHLHTRAFEFDA